MATRGTVRRGCNDVVVPDYPSPDDVLALAADTFDDFITTRFVDALPWAFRDVPDLYVHFREYFAAAFGVTPDSVCVVGSGAVGFSMGPDNFPRDFQPDSDIDVVVVSEALFDNAWSVLRAWGHPRRTSLFATEADWMSDRKDEVFWGWMSPDYLRFPRLRYFKQLLPLRDFRTLWFDTFQAVGLEFVGTDIAGRDINGRLYRSWDHFRGYQRESLRRLIYRQTVGIGAP